MCVHAWVWVGGWVCGFMCVDAWVLRVGCGCGSEQRKMWCAVTYIYAYKLQSPLLAEEL